MPCCYWHILIAFHFFSTGRWSFGKDDSRKTFYSQKATIFLHLLSQVLTDLGTCINNRVASPSNAKTHLYSRMKQIILIAQESQNHNIVSLPTTERLYILKQPQTNFPQFGFNIIPGSVYPCALTT